MYVRLKLVWGFLATILLTAAALAWVYWALMQNPEGAATVPLRGAETEATFVAEILQMPGADQQANLLLTALRTKHPALPASANESSIAYAELVQGDKILDPTLNQSESQTEIPAIVGTSKEMTTADHRLAHFSKLVGKIPTQHLDTNKPPVLHRNGLLDNRPITEFYGPITGKNKLPLAFFRIGVWQQRAASTLTVATWTSYAKLMAPLLIVVVGFLVYCLRNNQMNQRLLEQISAIDLQQQDTDVHLFSNGHNPEFVQELELVFNKFHNEIRAAEATSQKLVSEEKFVNYRANRYESILNTIPDGLLILDEDFKVVYVNQHMETSFQVSRLDITATPVEDWCDHEPLLAIVRTLKNDGQYLSTSITPIPDPRSPERTIGVSTHPLYLTQSRNGQSGLLLAFKDISQEIAAKESRTQFVGSVSHEVKAPLNTIGLYAQMLESQYDDHEFVLEAHNVIHQEVERMTRLINNLLSMTQIEMGTFDLDQQRIYLEELLKEVVDSLDHGDAKSRIHIAGAERIPPVLIDKDLMRIAISNLLTNAIKYSPEDSPITVNLEETADAISLTVTDLGQGISSEDQDKIFEKFYRSDNETTNQAQGHGLGLSIAQEIIRLHHGNIDLESTPGQGSSFTIELFKRTGITQQAI